MRALPRVAAILAGGLGTRLASSVPDRPKVLAEVGGRPFLSWVLDRLDQQGFERVVLCTGHRAGQVARTLGRSHGNLDLLHSPEPVPLGTAGALRYARDELGEGPVLVLNGDSWCDADLEGFAREHRVRRAMISLLLTQLDDTSAYGRVETDDETAVTRFREKSPESGPGWINSGIYLFEPSVIAAIPEGQKVSLETDIMPAWTGLGLHGFRRGREFLDIGTPECLERAQEWIPERAGGAVTAR
ncbi:MAG: nucleotidyltransferase family protein [Acidobacteriota bacterium]